jgi:hypothetical protein
MAIRKIGIAVDKLAAELFIWRRLVGEGAGGGRRGRRREEEAK